VSAADGRDEHLKFCKERALEYLDAGENPLLAWQSLSSDLSKNPLTRGHAGLELGMMQLMAGYLRTPAEMRRFIEGFN